MMNGRLRMGIAAGWLLVGLATPVWADVPDWQSLTTEQKNLLAPLASRWNHLLPKDRERFLLVAEQYPVMRPEQQARIRERLGQWAEMQPEQQQRIRENYRRFREMSPEEQQKVIERFRTHHSQMRGSIPAGAPLGPGGPGPKQQGKD